MNWSDRLRLELINLLCFSSCCGCGRDRKVSGHMGSTKYRVRVIPAHQKTYSEIAEYHNSGHSNLEIYDKVYCQSTPTNANQHQQTPIKIL